jgi:inosine/xanthosine triphosphatase
MLFALGTTNTPKTNAIREVLMNCPFLVWRDIQIQGFKVSSGVPDMPLTLIDLREGATHRAREVRHLCPEANYFVGMEWGVYRDSVGEDYWLTGVVYIENTIWEGHFGYSCHMLVPRAVVEKLYDGTGRDLEQIMHEMAGVENIGDNAGSFALWSDNMLTRTDQFRLATQCAIVPFFSPFYTSENNCIKSITD